MVVKHSPNEIQFVLSQLVGGVQAIEVDVVSQLEGIEPGGHLLLVLDCLYRVPYRVVQARVVQWMLNLVGDVPVHPGLVAI